MVNGTEPTPALTARGLVRAASTATLSTVQADADGWPYGSLVQVATDAAGRPLLLLSDLAEHTKNLQADARVSLLFDGTAGLDEPLTGARLTLLGRIAPDADASDQARYLRRFPGAAMFADFKDFHFYRVEPERGHLVAGFGRIHWVEKHALVLPPDLVKVGTELEAGVIEHMNADHTDAVRLMAATLPGLGDGPAELCGFDAEGCDVRVGKRLGRVAFPAQVRDAGEARATFSALARKLGGAV